MIHPNTPDKPADPASGEITSTLSELISSFGKLPVAAAVHELGLAKENASPEAQMQALRRYTLMIIDDKHPRSVAHMVARLTGLDTATGHELTQEQIGREMGVSKAAVSNREAQIADKLGLPRRSSPQARHAHQLMNRRNYSFAQKQAAQ